jgi:ABC-type branched-subunit amino acid transport system permease subunit
MSDTALAMSEPRAAAGRGFAGTETTVAAAVFLVLAAIPAVLTGYVVYILPQYMLFGVMAMSLGLLWGFVGVLSFGQAAFFSLGAYAMGLAMKSGGAVNPGYVGLLASLAIGGVLAGLIGYFLFSAGVRDAYFVIVTLALSIIVEQITVSQSQITGGWNGLFIDRMDLTLGSLGTVSLHGDTPVYYAVLLATAGIYFLLRWLTTAKFGKVLVGIRENEDRLTSLGFNSSLYKTGAFAISGAIACVGGAMYGGHAGFVAPSLGGVLFSTEVAIGGRASLLAALLGGIAVSSISNYLSAITPRYWQLVLGILFVAVITYFKGGVAGALARLRFRGRA